MRRAIYQTLATRKTYLLDQVNRATTSAYSLRQLSKTLRPLVRVVRTSDGQELDFYPSSNGRIDSASLLSFVGSGDGLVRRWYDAMGNNDLIELSNANCPKIVSSGVIVTTASGNIGIRFESSRSTKLVSATSVVTQFPMSQVVSLAPSVPSKGFFVKVGAAANGVGLGSGNATADVIGSSIIAIKEIVAWVPSSANYVNNAPVVMTLSEAGSSMVVRRDGVNLVTTNSNLTALPPSTGVYSIGGTTNRFSDCIVTESILMSYIDSNLIALLQNNMISKYN